MLMVIDDETKEKSYLWIYDAGPDRFQIYGRIDGGTSRVLVTCETREEAER